MPGISTARSALLIICSWAAPLGARAQSPLLPGDRFSPPPAIRREFRGVWVATVANIDWPSRPGLPTEQQQAELVAILDSAVALHLNAVILQVRPAADAFYASSYEPWSEYLTGEMGKPPSPYWDPLQFAVAEAHRRGLELHAWFNPYRARHPSAKSRPSTTHISVTRPELVRGYGRYLWMDPGETAVREHTIRVILDVVKHYDIDGVHIDDYFYPYKERDSTGALIDFPDSASFARYRAFGGSFGRDDWRRANVDQLVHDLYFAIKAAKPWVNFGISPFGIWRPGYPEQIRGFDPYTELFADSRKWLVNGWADYFVPQLYWPIGKPDERYPLLLSWWSAQNPAGRHLFIGNDPNRVSGNPGGWPAGEILDQIALTRANPGVAGNIFFSMRSFMRGSDSLPERMLAGPYQHRTLVPSSHWLDSTPPEQPSIRVTRNRATRATTVVLHRRGRKKVWLWLVRLRSGEDWRYDILPGTERSYSVGATQGVSDVDLVMVSAIDRSGNESFRAISKIDPIPRH